MVQYCNIGNKLSTLSRKRHFHNVEINKMTNWKRNRKRKWQSLLNCDNTKVKNCQKKWPTKNETLPYESEICTFLSRKISNTNIFCHGYYINLLNLFLQMLRSLKCQKLTSPAQKHNMHSASTQHHDHKRLSDFQRRIRWRPRCSKQRIDHLW